MPSQSMVLAGARARSAASQVAELAVTARDPVEHSGGARAHTPGTRAGRIAGPVVGVIIGSAVVVICWFASVVFTVPGVLAFPLAAVLGVVGGVLTAREVTAGCVQLAGTSHHTIASPSATPGNALVLDGAGTQPAEAWTTWHVETGCPVTRVHDRYGTDASVERIV